MPISRSIQAIVIAAACTAVAGCASPPPSATGPQPTGVVPAAASVAATPAAFPSPEARGARLTGLVELGGVPLRGARMHAFDLATGKEMALVAAGAGNYGLSQAAPAATDANGQFDYDLPDLAPNQVVKLVAEQGGKSLVTLFDGRGHAIGGAAPAAPPPAYRLQASATLGVTIKLRMSAATTATSKAFEGAIKIQFRLPESALENGLEGAIDAAMEALAALEARLASDPRLEEALADAIDENGEITDLPAFNAALEAAGLVDLLADKVATVMTDFADAEGDVETSTGEQPLDAVTSEDFPVGRIRITAEGDFTFTDDDGETITGSIADGAFVPTEADRDPDQADAVDSGGSSGGGSSGGSAGGGTAPKPGSGHGGLAVVDGELVEPTDAEAIAP